MTPEQYAYVEQQVAAIAGRRVHVPDDLAGRLYRALTRAEEVGALCDAHGNFPPTASLLADCLTAPSLHDDLAALCADGATARWPNGHRFAACLSHDVDRIVRRPWRERWREASVLRHVASPRLRARWMLSGVAHALGDVFAGRDDHDPYGRYLAEEDRYGFHSTFFVLPEAPRLPTVHDHYYRYGDRVRDRGRRTSFAEATGRVATLGWEIGLHGSYASQAGPALLRGERRQVATIAGQPVTSVRQHYLRMDAARTPDMWARAGLRADSTLGYSSAIGCRAGVAFPYLWPNGVFEAPLIIQDVALLRGIRDADARETALERAAALVRHIADTGGLLTLSWHTHPESPGAYEAYADLLRLVSDLGGWGCSLRDLETWWRARVSSARLAVSSR
jgi:peptidoglycan/xylan/chitin deacetylase (PgdA/CDA1 family)